MNVNGRRFFIQINGNERFWTLNTLTRDTYRYSVILYNGVNDVEIKVSLPYVIHTCMEKLSDDSAPHSSDLYLQMPD